MAQTAIYNELDIEIGAQVILPGKKWEESPLEIGEHGVLVIPEGLQPAGFHLILFLELGARAVIAQKNVGQENGGYFRHALAQTGRKEDNFVTWVMHDPIQVKRAGKDVWTDWHAVKPNRIDCWLVDKEGRLALLQIGVIAHNGGFRLLGEPRWRGRILVNPKGELVAKPDHPKWGPLLWNFGESRNGIRKEPEFQTLLDTATLEKWDGSNDELYPPLGHWDGIDWRIDWYIVFAGQGGQGIVKNKAGESAWVLRGDFLDISPDADGLVRLWHNDSITCATIHKDWGTKKNAPPKLLGVKRIQ